MKQHVIPIFIITVLLQHAATAQFSAGAHVSHMFDDNVNNNAQYMEDNISTMAGRVQYDWEGERWAGDLSYDAAVNYYQRTISRTNQFHGVTGQYHLYSGKEEENVVRFAASLGTGLFRDGYIFYDHDVFTLSVDNKYFLSASVINKAGYSFRSYVFPHSTWFSYSEHLVYGHLAMALSSQTTVLTQLDLGTKFYTESAETQSRGALSSLQPDVTQLTGMVRAGQRISDEIGLSAMLRFQWNLLKQSRYLLDENGYLISDDEIFDDHYGYEGLQASLTYSHIIGETMMLRITGGYLDKIYSQLPAFDISGNQTALQRNDDRFYTSVLMEKDFPEFGFTVKSSLDIISQSSNDPYYDYHNRAVSVEIVFPF